MNVAPPPSEGPPRSEAGITWRTAGCGVLLPLIVLALADPMASALTPGRAVALAGGVWLAGDWARDGRGKAKTHVPALLLLSYLDPWQAFVMAGASLAAWIIPGSVAARLTRSAMCAALACLAGAAGFVPGSGVLSEAPPPFAPASFLFPAAWLADRLPFADGADAAGALASIGDEAVVDDNCVAPDLTGQRLARIQQFGLVMAEPRLRGRLDEFLAGRGAGEVLRVAGSWYVRHPGLLARFAARNLLMSSSEYRGRSVVAIKFMRGVALAPSIVVLAWLLGIAAHGRATPAGARLAVAGCCFHLEKAAAALLGVSATGFHAASAWALAPFLSFGLLIATVRAFRGAERRTGASPDGRGPGVAIGGLFAAAFLFHAFDAPRMMGDSKSYLEMSATRTPVYPLFLRGLALLSPERWQAWVVFVQCLVVLAAAAWFAVEVPRLFARRPVSWLVFAGGAFFALDFHEMLSTEAFSVAAMLALLALFARAARRGDSGLACVAAAAAPLTVTLRPQFLFLHPVTLAFTLLHAHRREGSPARFRPFLAYVSAAVTAVLIIRGFNFMVHGHFAPIPFTGNQLVVAPVYVDSDAGTGGRFDARLPGLLDELRAHRLDRGACRTHYPGLPTYAHFINAYPGIWDRTLARFIPGGETKGGAAIRKRLDDITMATAVDRTLLSLSFALIRENPGGYLRLLLENLLGACHGILQPCLFVSALLGLALAAKDAPRPAFVFFATLLALHVCNLALILPVEPVLYRYRIYTTLPLFCLLVSLLESSACRIADARRACREGRGVAPPAAGG